MDKVSRVCYNSSILPTGGALFTARRKNRKNEEGGKHLCLHP